MSDGMGREPAYLSSHATNRYFIPNWGIIIKSPNFSDAILQYALHQHLALCRVFPFWIAEPNHLVTPIIIGAPVVFETHAISIAAIPLYGSNLHSLRLSIEQYEVF